MAAQPRNISEFLSAEANVQVELTALTLGNIFSRSAVENPDQSQTFTEGDGTRVTRDAANLDDVSKGKVSVEKTDATTHERTAMTWNLQNHTLTIDKPDHTRIVQDKSGITTTGRDGTVVTENFSSQSITTRHPDRSGSIEYADGRLPTEYFDAGWKPRADAPVAPAAPPTPDAAGEGARIAAVSQKEVAAGMEAVVNGLGGIGLDPDEIKNIPAGTKIESNVDRGGNTLINLTLPGGVKGTVTTGTDSNGNILQIITMPDGSEIVNNLNAWTKTIYNPDGSQAGPPSPMPTPSDAFSKGLDEALASAGIGKKAR